MPIPPGIQAMVADTGTGHRVHTCVGSRHARQTQSDAQRQMAKNRTGGAKQTRVANQNPLLG
eukprot:6797020-Lingulodinium_polyedra.AAC.1